MTLPVLFMSLSKKDRVTHTFYFVQSQTSIFVLPCILSLCENFQRTIVQVVRLLKSRAVVYDFESFCYKSGFMVREFASATENLST